MKRNYGIDFLRLLSMFMVVVLHTLGDGGILPNTEPLSLKYWVAWTLEIACYCSVNCFALISGYVMSTSRHKISRILKLWLQTLFYTLLITVIFAILMPGAVSANAVISAVFPFTRAEYWYISAYFGMLFLVPLLNAAIEHTDKRVLGSALLSVFVLFCVFPTVLRTDPYLLNNGFSVLWLCLLYLAGGYIRKYGVADTVKTGYAWLTVFLMIAISLFSRFAAEYLSLYIPAIAKYKYALISYVSPTMTLMAVGLLILCGKIRFKPTAEKWIQTLSPAALGVYLFHTNELVWQHIIIGFSAGFANYSCILMVLLILLSALGIFSIGIVTDLLRIKLFKLLKIDSLCAAVERRYTKALDRSSIK